MPWSSVPSCCWPRSSVSVEGPRARALLATAVSTTRWFPWASSGCGWVRWRFIGAGLPRLLGNGVEETRRVLTATLSVFGVLAVFSMLFRLDIARGYLAIALPLGAVALIGMRTVARRNGARSRRDGRFVHAVLAIGNPHSIRGLAASFARRPADGLKLVGACGPGLEGRTSLEISPTESIPVLPNGFDIEQAVIQSGADTVVLASGHLTSDEIRDLRGSWRSSTSIWLWPRAWSTSPLPGWMFGSSVDSR